MMQSFFHAVSQITILTEESREALAAILKPKEAGKGEVLVKMNTVCRYVYFVEKGLTRTFYFKNGKDITDWISPEGTFATSIVSFISGLPDRRGIEALEDCVLYALHHNDLEQLYEQYHDIERFGRLTVSSGLIQLQQRFDDLHFATAAERYQKIMNLTPSLIQRVPLGMLASYLGMTQETLSRIRHSSTSSR